MKQTHTQSLKEIETRARIAKIFNGAVAISCRNCGAKVRDDQAPCFYCGTFSGPQGAVS